MFSTLRNAFKDKEIRNKIWFTLFILLLYRIGSNITVPGVNAKAISQVAQTGLVPMLDTVTGGGLDNYSIFSLGVSPYITAQIVIQLLQMDIVPQDSSTYVPVLLSFCQGPICCLCIGHILGFLY